MNWAEEKFVKVFTRDTPTWLAWPWQARAMAALLMRKLEGDGRLAVGRLEPARAVALSIGLPIEVVEVGLPAMLEDGTLEAREDGLWWPKFEEAQESRKSDALNSRDYRARQRRETSNRHRQTASDGVRPRQPPEQNRTEQTRDLPAKKPREEKPPPDPRHQPLVKKLCEVFQSKRGTSYPFAPRHARLVQRLLAVKPAEHSPDVWPLVLAGAWGRALDARFPECSTLEDFEKQLGRHVGSSPDKPAEQPRVYAEGRVRL